MVMIYGCKVSQEELDAYNKTGWAKQRRDHAIQMAAASLRDAKAWLDAVPGPWMNDIVADTIEAIDQFLKEAE